MPKDIKTISHEEALKKAGSLPSHVKQVYEDGGTFFELDGIYFWSWNKNPERMREQTEHEWISRELQSLGLKWEAEFSDIDKKQEKLEEKEKQLQRLVAEAGEAKAEQEKSTTPQTETKVREIVNKEYEDRYNKHSIFKKLSKEGSQNEKENIFELSHPDTPVIKEKTEKKTGGKAPNPTEMLDGI